MNVGLTSIGSPRSPEVWSGVPTGVLSGLERLGVSVTAVDAEMSSLSERVVGEALGGALLMTRGGPRRLRAARADASVSAPMAMVRSIALMRHVSTLARLDGIVQLGSGYLLPPVATPYVTYEDMTVAQAARAAYPVWSTLPAGRLRRRISLQKRMYRRARACCFSTHWAATSAIEDYEIEDHKVHVVGIGANHLASSPDREWYPPRFLFVGKDWQRKNGDAVVGAFARLREEHPDARLELVGEVPPTISDGVTVHGVLPLGDAAGHRQIAELLRAATCFVMPSRHEPSALAYVEAAHAGLPSIVSSAGGSQELVGAGGIAVEPDDASALLNAMATLSDPALARSMGAQARRHAQMYTWDTVAERLLRALMPDRAASRDLAAFL